jgi:hypothetical protein
MKIINEDLPLSQLVTIFNDILRDDLELKELAPIYVSLQTLGQIAEPKDAIRLKSTIAKAFKLMNHKRHARTEKAVTPLAEQCANIYNEGQSHLEKKIIPLAEQVLAIYKA